MSRKLDNDILVTNAWMLMIENEINFLLNVPLMTLIYLDLWLQTNNYVLFSLQAHRVVLSSCSEYFQAMFTEPMRERSQTDIHLYGVSSVGLDMILNYIYTSNIVLSLANIQSVLSTASQLQVTKVLTEKIFFWS